VAPQVLSHLPSEREPIRTSWDEDRFWTFDNLPASSSARSKTVGTPSGPSGTSAPQTEPATNLVGLIHKSANNWVKLKRKLSTEQYTKFLWGSLTKSTKIKQNKLF